MMPHSQDRPDMQITGANIAQLRRERGLSLCAFARSLGQPVWLITLMETAHLEHSRQVIDLLPDSVIETLLTEIQTAYGVSAQCLTSHAPLSNHAAPSKGSIPQESLLYLPIAFTPEDAVDMLDTLLDLNMTSSRSSKEREQLLTQGFQSISMLFQLQLNHLQQTGNEGLAKQNRRQFAQCFSQRIKHWESLLL